MLKGKYAIVFAVDGFKGAGWLEATSDGLRGGDGVYQLAGEVTGTKNRMLANLEVEIEQQAIHNVCVPPKFTFSAEGTAEGRHFNLLGTGPLGIIIELAGEQVA